MTQKIFRAGNSTVVTIPQALLRELNLKPGSLVTVETLPDSDAIQIRKKPSSHKTTPEISQKELDIWLEKFVTEDKAVLDELALH